MKLSTLKLITLALFSHWQAISQPLAKESDLDKINTIFERMEVQGVETKEHLLYGYFFIDKDKSKLGKLKTDLVHQSYRLIALEERGGHYLLHVEKLEKHTRQSLQKREKDLRSLAAKHGVASFDGFDVGNADPTKPLVSNESFSKFIGSRQGNDLFDLGIKLYDLEIFNRAELVFRECIKQNVKPDTSAFKLGNTLINSDRADEGREFLTEATKYNPQYLSAFFNLGALSYDKGQFQKSIEHYKQADNLKPNDDRIIYGIAASQYAIGLYEQPLENCKKALQLNKENENAKQLLRMFEVKGR